jgi:hypothetical protein
VLSSKSSALLELFQQALEDLLGEQRIQAFRPPGRSKLPIDTEPLHSANVKGHMRPSGCIVAKPHRL